ncbi:MAG: hypothetical protein ABI233_07115 [Chthoniobacterales bacterium]
MHRVLGKLVIAVCILGAPTQLAQAEEPLHARSEQFFPLPLDGKLNIENLDGSIHVFGWYEPRVRLAAVCNAYTAPRLKQIRVDTKATPDSLTVRTIIRPTHGLFADRSGTVDYILNVPEQAQLTLHVANGEILVQGLRGGSARIELGNGRVFLRNCFARIEAHAVHGAMDVFYEWWENAPAVFHLVLDHGRIGALLPVAARIRVDAATANGQVGNGFGIAIFHTAGPGHMMRGANAPDPPVSFHLRTGGGNISIDSWH